MVRTFGLEAFFRRNCDGKSSDPRQKDRLRANRPPIGERMSFTDRRNAVNSVYVTGMWIIEPTGRGPTVAGEHRSIALWDGPGLSFKSRFNATSDVPGCLPAEGRKQS